MADEIIKEKIQDEAKLVGNNVWGKEGCCEHCGAGDNYHHSWSCPTDLHVDKVAV